MFALCTWGSHIELRVVHFGLDIMVLLLIDFRDIFQAEIKENYPGLEGSINGKLV